MPSKSFVTDYKTIVITAVIAVALFLSGWFIGQNTSKCKCSGDCCHPAENINENR